MHMKISVWLQFKNQKQTRMLSALPAHPGSLGQKGSGAAAAALLPVAPIRDQSTKETSDNAAEKMVNFILRLYLLWLVECYSHQYL